MNKFNGEKLETLRQIGIRIWNDIKQYYIAVPLFAIYVILTKKICHEYCMMRILVGIPCPGCGMTRALIALMHGDVAQSLQYHPLLICWILFFVWMFVRRYIQGKTLKGINAILAVLVILMVIVYIYRMATVFPNQEPMTYQTDNLMTRIALLLHS